MAVAAFRCNCWKVDFKSLLDTRIGTLGKSHQVVMVQLTSRLMHAPNMQERSSSVLMQMLTEVPEDHLKLSERSFSTIHPCLSMVFCLMFIGAMRMPGI
jgi:hypothetical protein